MATAILRQVQKGSYTLASASTSGTVTLPTTLLDTSKSILFFSTRGGTASPAVSFVRGQLTNTTTLTFTRTTSGADIQIQWYVAEFLQGVFVQRGVSTPDVSDFPVFLDTPVALDNSFVVASKSQSATTLIPARCYFGIALTDTSTLNIYHRGAAGLGDVAWQVVQYDDCTVQRGTVAVGSTATSANSAAFTAVDLNKSLLTFYSTVAGTTVNAAISSIRGRIGTATTVAANRQTSGVAATGYYEVISFTGNEAVRSNLIGTATTATSAVGTFATLTDWNNAITYLSSSSGSNGLTSISTTVNLANIHHTAVVTSNTAISITRTGATSASNTAAYQVVEFAPPPATVTTARIDCGGIGFTTSDGKVWTADNYFSGGSPFTQSFDVFNTTTDDAFYQSLRFSATNFSYNIPVVDGSYAVRLAYLDEWAGDRKLHIDIEGTRVETNYSPGLEFGQQNYGYKTYYTDVTDGILTVTVTNADIANANSNAVLSGLEIYPGVAPLAITASPVSSVNSFGAAQLKQSVAALPVASANQFGSATFSLTKAALTITASPIASVNSSGVTSFNQRLNTSPVSSTNTFGAVSLTQRLSTSPVSSANTFGSAVFSPAIAFSPTSSVNAFGSAESRLTIASSAIASHNNFGTASFSLNQSSLTITTSPIDSTNSFGGASFAENIATSPTASVNSFGSVSARLRLQTSQIAPSNTFNSVTFKQKTAVTQASSVNSFGAIQASLKIVSSEIPSANEFGSATFVAQAPQGSIVVSPISSANTFGSTQLNLGVAASPSSSVNSFGASAFCLNLTAVNLAPTNTFASASFRLSLTQSAFVNANSFGVTTFRLKLATTFIVNTSSYGSAVFVLSGSYQPQPYEGEGRATEVSRRGLMQSVYNKYIEYKTTGYRGWRDVE